MPALSPLLLEIYGFLETLIPLKIRLIKIHGESEEERERLYSIHNGTRHVAALNETNQGVISANNITIRTLEKRISEKIEQIFKQEPLFVLPSSTLSTYCKEEIKKIDFSSTTSLNILYIQIKYLQNQIIEILTQQERYLGLCLKSLRNSTGKEENITNPKSEQDANFSSESDLALATTLTQIMDEIEKLEKQLVNYLPKQQNPSLVTPQQLKEKLPALFEKFGHLFLLSEPSFDSYRRKTFNELGLNNPSIDPELVSFLESEILDRIHENVQKISSYQAEIEQLLTNFKDISLPLMEEITNIDNNLKEPAPNSSNMIAFYWTQETLQHKLIFCLKNQLDFLKLQIPATMGESVNLETITREIDDKINQLIAEKEKNTSATMIPPTTSNNDNPTASPPDSPAFFKPPQKSLNLDDIVQKLAILFARNKKLFDSEKKNCEITTKDNYLNQIRQLRPACEQRKKEIQALKTKLNNLDNTLFIMPMEDKDTLERLELTLETIDEPSQETTFNNYNLFTRLQKENLLTLELQAKFLEIKNQWENKPVEQKNSFIERVLIGIDEEIQKIEQYTFRSPSPQPL